MIYVAYMWMLFMDVHGCSWKIWFLHAVPSHISLMQFSGHWFHWFDCKSFVPLETTPFLWSCHCPGFSGAHWTAPDETTVANFSHFHFTHFTLHAFHSSWHFLPSFFLGLPAISSWTGWTFVQLLSSATTPRLRLVWPQRWPLRCKWAAIA